MRVTRNAIHLGERRGPRRSSAMPYPEGTTLYLLGSVEHGPLTREGEIELARRVEEGELAILRALVESPATLRELAAVGRDLAEGRLQARDVLRSADEDDRGRGEALRRLTAALKRAGSLARTAERGARLEPRARRRLLSDLERVHIHRRILDRVAGVLREAPPRNKAGRRVLEAIAEGRRIADRAKADIVRANFGLVVMFAKRHVKHGLPLHDLIQEGNLGLMRAVDKFDPRRGIRFGTYAAWWVRQQMTRAVIDQGKTIRVPVHLADARRRLLRAQRVFEHVHGRAPTTAELSEQSGLWPEKVHAILEMAPEPISLDAPVGHEDETSLRDFVADRARPAPDEELARDRMRAQAKELLERLSPREREILRRRFGLDGAAEQTLAEIGESLSISRERVRQIEAEALRKLRGPSESSELDSYLAA
jgi:RNA polymerase primary sigma factor